MWARSRRLLVSVLGILTVAGGLVISLPSADAACGAVSCFVTIGSQQQVPQAGLLTMNFIYSYTPMNLPSGSTGLIAEADQIGRRIIPNHHNERSTYTNSFALDFNYGVTDRLGLQVTLPYMTRRHEHYHFHQGQNEDLSRFSDKGIGDIRVMAKYNVLASLKNMLVFGVGTELPTGDYRQTDNLGGVLEPAGQLGRGQFGLVGTMYQSYEILPHRLNQFVFASYRHTFKNNDGYQFGDEYIVNGGFNLVTLPWLVFTAQVNYRYMTHDSLSASIGSGPILDRGIPNTGSSWFGAAPGVLFNIGDTWQAYFYAQVPLYRDANNNLAQATSYTFGVTKYFQLFTPGA